MITFQQNVAARTGQHVVGSVVVVAEWCCLAAQPGVCGVFSLCYACKNEEFDISLHEQS